LAAGPKKEGKKRGKRKERETALNGENSGSARKQSRFRLVPEDPKSKGFIRRGAPKKKKGSSLRRRIELLLVLDPQSRRA